MFYVWKVCINPAKVINKITAKINLDIDIEKFKLINTHGMGKYEKILSDSQISLVEKLLSKQIQNYGYKKIC